MTPDDFRKLALELPGAEERSHMDHPDFRVGGRIFATLGYPDDGWGMVKLNPEQRADLMGAHPDAFIPIPGGWGKRGATSVNLKKARKPAVRKALAAAWRNTAR